MERIPSAPAGGEYHRKGEQGAEREQEGYHAKREREDTAKDDPSPVAAQCPQHLLTDRVGHAGNGIDFDSTIRPPFWHPKGRMM
jgi:hypothetical protein